MQHSHVSEYPASVAEVLDDSISYRPATLRAVSAFAQSRPWRGTLVERWRKLLTVNKDLSRAYGIEPPLLVLGPMSGGNSGTSYYSRALHQITLCGRLSVVTFLHEFAHAIGKDEREACRWSLNLFRACFPRSWSRLQFRGHMVVARRRDTPSE